MQVLSVGQEDPLEEGMETRSRKSWTEEPGGYSSKGHKKSNYSEAT